MKKNTILSLLALIIFTAFNKPTIPLSDYRDSYVGIYSCKYYKNHLNSENMLYALDTGWVSITISKDPLDSVLQIDLGQKNVKAKLINKVLQPYPQKGRYRGQFFATDSISLGITSTMASSIRYIGKKK